MNRRSQAGQALVLASLGLTLFLLAAGLAIDMGYLRYQKRRMQSAADSAAIAGAAELNNGDWTAAAIMDASTDGFQDTSVGGTATVTPTLVTCPDSSPNCVQVTIAQQQPLFFMHIIPNISLPIVSTKAVARLGTGPTCIYALSTASDAILVADGWNLNTYPVPAGNPGFVIFSVSNDHPETIVTSPGCALIDNGTLQLPGAGVNYNYMYLSAIGAGSVSTGLPTVIPTPVSGIVPAGDPLQQFVSSSSGVLPSVSACATPGQIPANAVFKTGAVPSGPYPCGLEIAGSGTVTLDGAYSLGGSGAPCPTPGLTYVYGNAVTFGNSCALSITSTGTVQSGPDGVTIYNSANNASVTPTVPGGSIAINFGASLAGSSTYSGAIVQLSAGSSGIPGIVLYQDPGNNQPASVTLAGYNGASPPSSYLWGSLYFPSAQLTLYGIGYGAGVGATTDFCSTTPRLTTAVAFKLVLDGNLNFGSNDCDSPPTSCTSANNDCVWPSAPLPSSLPQDPIKAAVLVQ